MTIVHFEVQNNLRNLYSYPEFGNLIDTFERSNETGSSYHAELQCGQVLITASKSRLRGVLPRHANFRGALASRFNPTLFESSTLPEGDVTYVILSHGVKDDDPIQDYPSFVDLLVPDEASRKIICEIDLLQTHNISVLEGEFDSKTDVQLVSRKDLRNTQDESVVAKEPAKIEDSDDSSESEPVDSSFVQGEGRTEDG